nr:MAG TPA: hypothetical protein [Caudoviricetes sp.]
MLTICVGAAEDTSPFCAEHPATNIKVTQVATNTFLFFIIKSSFL